MLSLFRLIRIMLLLSFGLATQATQVLQPPQLGPSQKRPFGVGTRALPPTPQGVIQNQPKATSPNQAASQAQSAAHSNPQGQKGSAANALEACKTEGSKSPILVLSIDGASVRGIAQFELLLGIEEKINAALAADARAANQPFTRLNITEIFDFFAGTSAGSINVGALLIPSDYALTNTPGHVNKPKFSSSELKEMLPDTLKAAFSSSTFRKFRTLQVPGVGGLLGSKFTAGPFEQLLQELAGQARMSDLVKPAVITSYDLRTRDIMNFSTHDACTSKKDDVIQYQPESNKDFYRKDTNVFDWQAMRASSAAPVYYKPFELKIGGKLRALIDAGLFIMSPTLLAWIEAQKIYPGRPLTIISISSGNIDEVREVQTQGSTAGSIPKALQPTIETALEGQQALTDLMMRDLPGIKYHRLSFEVKNKVFDDVSPENIKALENAAKKTITTSEFRVAVDDIVAAIRERKAKLKKNPQDFTPYVCQAKVEFRNNTDLRLSREGPSSEEKKEKVKEALEKMAKANEKTGTVDAQGKKMVEFGDQDKALQTSATKAKQSCQTLLGQMKLQTPQWKSDNCNNVIDPKEICQALSTQTETIASQLKNSNCNRLIKKPKACEGLSNQQKTNAKEWKDRNCRTVLGG